MMKPASEHPSADGLWSGLRLAPDAAPGVTLEAGAEAAIVVAQGEIRWVGARSALPAEFTGLAQHNGSGALVTPGLVDCHTHLVYGGQRANEFAMRLAGATYEEVAKAGGGIVSSVRATREADEDALFAQAAPRLEQLLADGVCAIEIKSGYGLSLEHERKQLRVARRLGEAYGVTVRTTFLGAHALPPEYAGRSGDYIDLVCREMLPALAAEGLVDAVDVFCERIAFSLEETEQVFQAAKALGLPTTSSICRPMALRRCAGRAPWPCCCPAPTTRCATRTCRPSPRCAPRACRWPCPPITTPAHRRR
jgi:imidazolonepropionase